MSQHSVPPSLAATDLQWAEVSYGAYRALPAANVSRLDSGGAAVPGATAAAAAAATINAATTAAAAALANTAPAATAAAAASAAAAAAQDALTGAAADIAGGGAEASGASIDELLVPLAVLPARPRSDVAAPNGFGGYGGNGAAPSSPVGDGHGGGMEVGEDDEQRVRLVLHPAPVGRSGHTLTAVATAAVEGGEVLLLFGGEAATRLEHRVAEEFVASSLVAENVTLTRRAAKGGTYVGTRNLDPMQQAWGLEPAGQQVTLGFEEHQGNGEQLWEATPPEARYWSDSWMTAPTRLY